MSAIPAAVLKVLDDWSISYSHTDDQELFEIMQSNPPASYSSKVANVVFLKDDLGKIQVVIPGNRMLDLSQLSLCDVVYIAADVPTNDNGQSDLGRIDTLISQVEPVLSMKPAIPGRVSVTPIYLNIANAIAA